jgi:hypothetical protein
MNVHYKYYLIETLDTSAKFRRGARAGGDAPGKITHLA